MNIEVTETLTFTHDRPFQKLQRHSRRKLCTSTLAKDRILRSTADLASALSNVNNVKICDLLAFLVMLLFYSLCSHPKIIFGGGVHF